MCFGVRKGVHLCQFANIFVSPKAAECVDSIEVCARDNRWRKTHPPDPVLVVLSCRVVSCRGLRQRAMPAGGGGGIGAGLGVGVGLRVSLRIECTLVLPRGELDSIIE